MPRARISEGRGEGEERTGVRLCSLVLFCGHAILTNGYPASGVYTPPSPKGEGLTAPSVSRCGGKRKRERKTRSLCFCDKIGNRSSLRAFEFDCRIY